MCADEVLGEPLFSIKSFSTGGGTIKGFIHVPAWEMNLANVDVHYTPALTNYLLKSHMRNNHY